MADDCRIGVDQPFPFKGGWNEFGEHESNPLAGPSDTFGFEGWGGRTIYDGRRSDVDHSNVDRQPMIAHPLSGPHPGRRARSEG